MRPFLTLAGISALAAPALADGLTVEVTIPRLQVAEYHRPYVAVWIAQADHSVAANVAVWYQLDTRSSEPGETWLKDLRQWWRRTGRTLEMPADGISGPTKAPGTHRISLAADAPALKDLPPGNYQLVVEASREVGGREMLTLPFNWPLKAGETQSVSGERELGEVRLSVNR